MAVELPRASDAAVRLFACFSRFEFALKESGYVRADRHGAAQPDWDKFAALETLPATMEHLRISGGVAELFADPPKRQVAAGNHWTWAAAEPITDAVSFIRAIKQVRNNLFHGGKAGTNPRDDHLCDDAVACLIALLDLDPGVRNVFRGLY